jgi:cytochrome c-type biogenesis protein CcmH/NrfG
MDPDDPTLWWGKGATLLLLDRSQEALHAYEQALRLRPDYPEAWWGKAQALIYLSEPDKALAAYDQALRFHPDDPLLWWAKAEVLLLLARQNEAVQCLCHAWHKRQKLPSSFESTLVKAFEELGCDLKECE